MSPQLSVIIPVYNAGDALCACLDSVLGQRILDLEVVCVDDGSTDGSDALLEAYARRDARLKMLRQANRGQGVARNRGLECAHGEFVQFVDADDALAVPDALERLLATMRRERLDTLFFDAQTHVCSESLRGQPLPIRAEDYVRRGDYSAVSSGPDLFAAFLKNREYSPSPCLLMIRRAFLDANHIRFPEARIFYEDNIFMTRVLLAAQRASHRPWPLYRRNVWAGSTMTSSPTVRHLRGWLACYQDARALLARAGWDRQMRAVLRDRARIYKLHVRRFLDGHPEIAFAARSELSSEERCLLDGIRLYPLHERIVNGVHCLKDRGLFYTVRRIFAGRERNA